MAQWKGIMSLLLAILYLPAASLCLVERAGLIPGEECCTANSADDSGSSSPSDSTCCALASPTYKLADDRSANLVAPVLTLVLPARDTSSVHEPARFGITPLLASPPELPVCWQFSCRTALPPRAPSFVA